MRHFLPLSFTAPILPPGMIHPAGERLLVALSRLSHAAPPGLGSARLLAIPLPMITAPANPLLLRAKSTVEQSVAGDLHSRLRPQKAGQRVLFASFSTSEDGPTVICGAHFPKARQVMGQGERADGLTGLPWFALDAITFI